MITITQKLRLLLLCSALAMPASTFATQDLEETAQPTDTVAVAAPATELPTAEIANAQGLKMRNFLLANADRRALMRSIVKTIGVTGGKFGMFFLKNRVANWGTKIGTKANGCINGNTGAGIVVDFAVPETIGAIFALGFDAAMEKVLTPDFTDTQASNNEAIGLGVASALVDATGAFVGFGQECCATAKMPRFEFGVDGGKGHPALLHRKLIALLISTALRASKDGLHKKVFAEDSIAMPALDQLQNITRFVDVDAVIWNNLYAKKGNLEFMGVKKLLTGSLGRTLAAMFDGRVISKTGSSAKWNSFVKSLIGAWTGVFAAPVVGTAVEKVYPHGDFLK